MLTDASKDIEKLVGIQRLHGLEVTLRLIVEKSVRDGSRPARAERRRQAKTAHS